MPDARPEFALIEWIRANCSSQEADGILAGIGDDSAVLSAPNSEILVTADMLMDGVHFVLDEVAPERIGHKILGVNLSDIAAMAGVPWAAFVSLAIPKTMSVKTVQAIMRGMSDLAGKFDVTIAGGDTNSWDGPFVANVTLLGKASSKGPVLRSTAQPGDSICVTGSLGGSILGKHLDVQPRIQEALKIHEAYSLHSMIDVSDGLVADLFHILEQSKVNAILNETAIPISEAAKTRKTEKSPLEQALSDGEDFELLFTLPSKEAKALCKDSQNTIGVSITEIGTIVELEAQIQVGLQRESGEQKIITQENIPGWNHRFDDK